jgi:regulator of nonsense transcripts 1
MEGAFTHVGNHLISDSAAAINAGDDDLSTLDADENLLYGKYGGRKGLGNARRRNDDDDNGTDAAFDDDDMSMASVPVGAMKDLAIRNTPEEEKKLPPHACAYVYHVAT